MVASGLQTHHFRFQPTTGRHSTNSSIDSVISPGHFALLHSTSNGRHRPASAHYT